MAHGFAVCSFGRVFYFTVNVTTSCVCEIIFLFLSLIVSVYTEKKILKRLPWSDDGSS